jgi:hypothetical protein
MTYKKPRKLRDGRNLADVPVDELPRLEREATAEVERLMAAGRSETDAELKAACVEMLLLRKVIKYIDRVTDYKNPDPKNSRPWTACLVGFQLMHQTQNPTTATDTQSPPR